MMIGVYADRLHKFYAAKKLRPCSHRSPASGAGDRLLLIGPVVQSDELHGSSPVPGHLSTVVEIVNVVYHAATYRGLDLFDFGAFWDADEGEHLSKKQERYVDNCSCSNPLLATT